MKIRVTLTGTRNTFRKIFTCNYIFNFLRFPHLGSVFGNTTAHIRTDVGKFSSVNRTIADWNRLPEGAIGTSLAKTHVFRKRVRKVYQ
jgi:hypothetical protein